MIVQRSPRSRRWLRSGLALAALAAGARTVSAQPPHYNRVPSMERVRLEFLDNVRRAVGKTLDQLKEAVQRTDTTKALDLFVDGALYTGSDGINHYGFDGIRDGIGARVERSGGLALTVLDFTASGALAYQYGRYTYAAGPDGTGFEEGTYVLVMQQDGRGYKIRSFIERADGSP
ncbi:MAG: nuclear transport factor 2 family protein [Gemmatimonadales bacterium]